MCGGRGSRLLSGQVGIINLAASHVIMLTANWARGRRRCGWKRRGNLDWNWNSEWANSMQNGKHKDNDDWSRE